MANYLKRLPLRKGIEFIDVTIRQGTQFDAQLWQERIQPVVSIANVNRARPDAHWNWPGMLNMWSKSERALGRVLSFFVITIPTKGAKQAPLAQMLLSEGYPSLDGGNAKSVYVWYLAGAPADALKQLGVDYAMPGLVLEALLDTAIQRSYELGYDGRLGLHAAPNGGDFLYSSYRDRGRLIALGASVSLTLARRMRSFTIDERYFWADPKLAQSLSNALNYLR